MKTIAERKERFVRFENMDPTLTRLVTVDVESETPKMPHLTWANLPDRLEWAYRRWECLQERLQWLDDDTIPYVGITTGTEIFAEAFGCPVHDPGDSNPFALPLIHSAEEVVHLKVPDLWNSKIALIFDAVDKLRERAGKDVLLRLPDIQAPMDIAALIWAKEDFFMALYDEPEAVKELAAKVRVLLCQFFDEWFRRYGDGVWAHFPSYYLPKGITLSEDEIGAVNPAMFREFFAPELDFLSNRYGGIGIHCCANSRHQWRGLSQVEGLRMINICQPKTVTEYSVDFFKNICGQVPMELDIAQPGMDVHFLRNMTAKTRDEAKRLVEWAYEH